MGPESKHWTLALAKLLCTFTSFFIATTTTCHSAPSLSCTGIFGRDIFFFWPRFPPTSGQLGNLVAASEAETA